MAAPLRTSPPLRRSPSASAPGAHLEVLPGRRRVAGFMVLLTVLVGVVLIGAVLLHTRLAERQLEIDDLERSVRQQQEEYDILRAQRAELRAPTRLAADAGALGMVAGAETTYLEVDPMVLAVTIARTGELPPGVGAEPGDNARMQPLDQFRLVKSVSAEAP
jgi:cell division protein FtsL